MLPNFSRSKRVPWLRLRCFSSPAGLSVARPFRVIRCSHGNTTSHARRLAQRAGVIDLFGTAKVTTGTVDHFAGMIYGAAVLPLERDMTSVIGLANVFAGRARDGSVSYFMFDAVAAWAAHDVRRFKGMLQAMSEGAAPASLRISKLQAGLSRTMLRVRRHAPLHSCKREMMMRFEYRVDSTHVPRGRVGMEMPFGSLTGYIFRTATGGKVRYGMDFENVVESSWLVRQTR